MRVVIDTNVVVSGLLFSGVPGQLFALALSGQFEMIASNELHAELKRTLSRPKFAGRFKKLGTSVSKAMKAFESRAAIISAPSLIAPVCRDPDDDWILACAVAGAVSVIVTGDRDLLILGNYQGIEILTPAAFLARLTTP